MKSPITEPLCSQPAHSYGDSRKHPSHGCRIPYPNALTHGLRSGHVLVPGDNVAEFRALRHRLFHLHKPRTIAEARCVETLAANEWRAARCRLEQVWFKEQLGAAMGGHPDATGYLCSPDLHRLHHRGTDCRREERSLERSTSEAETSLKQMQTQRTGNLTGGMAAVLEDYTVFLAEGEPVVEAAAAPEMEAGADEPEAAAPEAPAETTASPSADGGNSNGPERNPDAPPPRFPVQRSKRQRDAAEARLEGDEAKPPQ